MADTTTRRDVLKITGLIGAGALLGARGANAAVALSMMHESSFIKAYDDHFQKVIIPAYEKASGNKLTYELVSVGST